MQHTKATLFFIVALLFAYGNGQAVRGIWYWTWSGSFSIGNPSIGIAFSGQVDADAAISDSASVVGHLSGTKFLSLGGGNGAGSWSSGAISKVASYCNAKRFGGYQGIAFDIEEGASGLGGAFVNAFKACKNNGYKVLVTVSHSTPYGIGDGVSLMNTFFANAGSIDYMSPQLYTTGYEGSNDFTANGVSWSAYSKFSGKLVPSIVSASMYSNAQSYFKNLGINTVGYIQWKQSAIGGGSGGNPSSPPSKGNNGPTRCGGSWNSANGACGKKCASDADCPGSHCWADLSLSPCNAAVAGSSDTYQSGASSAALEPAAIGIIVGGCVIGVIMIVVAVIVIVSANKRTERA